MPAAKYKILVVEDEPVSLKVLVDYLCDGHFKVETAEDGKQALSKLKHSPDGYSLIVLDRIMPHMGGMEMIQHMQKSSELNRIPVVMLTGVGEREDIIDAVEAGVFDYLTKPVEKNLLIKMAKQAIQSFNESEIIVH